MQNDQINYHPISSEVYPFDKIPVDANTFKSLDYSRLIPTNDNNIPQSNDNNIPQLNDNNFSDYSDFIIRDNTQDDRTNTNSATNSTENSDLCGHKYPRNNFANIYSIRT